jgi:hypothetical protein
MSVIINGTDGVTFNDASLQGAAASPFGLKNRIINGDMVVDQRNAGASVTPANGGVTYTVDRWKYFVTQASKLTAQQNAGSVTPPAGFSNYLGTTSSSAYSVISSDLFTLYHAVEGFNTADLAWGTANARTITISFWVRSSLTGTHSGAIQNQANNRSYAFSYTISAANTWEYKTVTIPGDTSGTWITNNGIGLSLYFNLGAGSTYSTTAGSWQAGNFTAVTGATSVVGTNGATFYITGVQLERNTTATPFEWIPYTTELQLCQRYFYSNKPGINGNGICTGSMFSATGFLTTYRYPVTMRAAPTLTVSSLSDFYAIVASNVFTPTSISVSGAGPDNTRLDVGVSSTTVGFAGILQTGSVNSALNFSSEL